MGLPFEVEREKAAKALEEKQRKEKEEYEKTKKRWEECLQELSRYSEVLKGTGVMVKIPSVPVNYEDLKASIGEMEREIERVKSIAEEYELLSKKWDALAMKLQRAGLLCLKSQRVIKS